MLTESYVFEDEILSGTESADHPAKEMPEPHDHGKNLIGTVRIEIFAKSFILRVCDVLARHRGHESLYGEKVRLFTAGGLQAILLESSLTVMAERGVRVISDCLPPRVSRTDEYKQILELERKLGRRPEFAAIARYTHCLAHRAELVSVKPSRETWRMNNIIAQPSSSGSRDEDI